MVAFAVGGTATVAILINALFLQSGPHPAPIFRGVLLPLAAAETTSRGAGALPRARPPEAAPAPVVPAKSDATAAARTPGEIVADIQRELARRGFYEGPADGFYGPKTDAALRDFEQTAGLKASSEPSEALLRTITRSSVKPGKPAVLASAPTPPRPVPAAEPVSKRVAAVQRALSEYGYAQLKPTGLVDAETRAAIEKFERERKLPVTGQVSDRVTRELSAITGRALD